MTSQLNGKIKHVPNIQTTNQIFQGNLTTQKVEVTESLTFDITHPFLKGICTNQILTSDVNCNDIFMIFLVHSHNSPWFSTRWAQFHQLRQKSAINPMKSPCFLVKSPLSHGFHRTWTVGSPPCLGGPRGRAAPVADAPREQCEAANASVASKEKA